MTLYDAKGFSVASKNKELILSAEKLTDRCRADLNGTTEIFQMQAIAAHDFEADKMSVILTLKNEEYAQIAEQFHYIPCIKQRKENICGAHVFRSPVAIFSDGEWMIALIPDMLTVDRQLAELTFLDMRFAEDDKTVPYLEFGLIRQKSEPHMYYIPTGETLAVKEGTVLPFYVMAFCGADVWEAFHQIQTFLFETYAASYVQSVLPQTVSFDTYAKYGNSFGESMYREEAVGAGIPLTTFLKEDGSYSGREYADDQFFHCWFNNMRTARELYAFGKRQNHEKWIHMARQIKKLLLSAPQQDGLFPTIYAPHDGGWKGSSLQGGGPEYYSLPDCAWTAYQLLLYEKTCEKSQETAAFLQNFADGLTGLVLPDGTFPVWVRKDGGKDEVTGRLMGSTASVLCALFLAEYAQFLQNEITPDADAKKKISRYIQAAADYMEYISKNCLLTQKFEDFELYYSCSAKPEDFYDPVSRMYGQNTLAMQWTAEAYLALYKLTHKKEYMTYGRFALDLMCLYQQIWNPPYVSLYAFGGFGVMNTDAEWNDARQAQFAETFSNYYDVTGDKIYYQRGIAALRASFVLMVIDENADVSPHTVTPREWLNEQHGGMAENYGHDGIDARSGQSGFHWGSGSALVSAAEYLRRYGETAVDPFV
ncbi:MAG: hypothetical protein IKC46_05350 [Lachnospiraceae bacterium]|nr:hypothetical protein [Lachnospiraceae bacterium]